MFLAGLGKARSLPGEQLSGQLSRANTALSQVAMDRAPMDRASVVPAAGVWRPKGHATLPGSVLKRMARQPAEAGRPSRPAKQPPVPRTCSAPAASAPPAAAQPAPPPLQEEAPRQAPSAVAPQRDSGVLPPGVELTSPVRAGDCSLICNLPDLITE